MEEELKYIKCQSLFWDYSEEIRQISYDKFNQNQLKMGGILSFAADCFALGVIVAKKSERARFKINNDKNLKRQDELLLEIEVLKLKNKKLENVLAYIKAECLNTNKILKGYML